MAQAELRRAAYSDVDQILAIERCVSPGPWPRSRFAAACGEEDGGGPRALVLDAGEVSAFLVYSRVLDEVTVENIAVRPERQRQGLAAAMLGEFLCRENALGSARCLLEVRASNAAALALYRRLGFVKDGLRRNYYPLDGGREDAVLMSRWLGESD